MCWHGQFQQMGSTELKQQKHCCRGSLSRGKEQAGQPPNLEVCNTHLLTSPSVYHPCCGNEAKNNSLLLFTPPIQAPVGALVGFTASLTQHSCLAAQREERGACSPSTITGHRLASLFTLLGAAEIWPHAIFVTPLPEGSKPGQGSSSPCQQQPLWCPFLSRQQFCTCLGQWKNLALGLQTCTLTR